MTKGRVQLAVVHDIDKVRSVSRGRRLSSGENTASGASNSAKTPGPSNWGDAQALAQETLSERKPHAPHTLLRNLPDQRRFSRPGKSV
jgi:hypothetical protein